MNLKNINNKYSNMLLIDVSKFKGLFQKKFDVSSLYLFQKSNLCFCLFVIGMSLAYFGSLHPWFLWPLMETYPVFSCVFLIPCLLVSNSMKQTMFYRKKILMSILIYTIVSFYLCFSTNAKLISYLINFFTIVIFYALERVDVDLLQRLMTIICKVMALLLLVSMPAFLLYLIGFPFPSKSVSYGDNFYSFNNYYFFMIDDRFLLTLIPRFQSVFLEPGHLGSATTLLLMTQFGRWKKWYNVVLIIASLMTFSLAAYAILITLVFLNLWVQRKNIMAKAITMIAVISLVISGSFFYNDGENLINQLILARLEVDDSTGEMVGNNRVTEDFEKEFDSFLSSSDVLWGRDMSRIERGSGNSGYRVFIYSNGILCTMLVFLFYAMSFSSFKDYRYLISVIIISLMIFWIRGYPLWYSNFFPLMACANACYQGKIKS